MTHCNILSPLQVLHGLLYLLNLHASQTGRKCSITSVKFNFSFDDISISCSSIIFTFVLFIEILRVHILVVSGSFGLLSLEFSWQNANGKLPHFSDFVFGWVFASINSLNSILLASLFWFKGSNQTKNADLRFTKLLFWTLLRSFQIQGHRK